MTKYVLKRLLHGAFSIVVVILIVMVLVYGLMDRNLVFAKDGGYTKQSNNTKTIYMYQKWEEFGYLDYFAYPDYLNMLVKDGEIDEETRTAAVTLGRAEDGSDDSEVTAKYVAQFNDYCKKNGMTVVRLPAVLSRGRLAKGGQQYLFAHKDYSVLMRLWNYFKGLIFIDNIHYVPEENDIGERKLTFTLYDPLYNPTDKDGNYINDEKVFSPAIIGNGTKNKYLVYFDGKFPYIHQNLATIHLGTSFTVNQGVDVYDTMNRNQGAWVQSLITYPTGLQEMSADNLHTATYIAGSRETSTLLSDRFTDDYTNTAANLSSMSRIGYSFVIGIISTILVYILGLPIGVLMARYKEGILDKVGTVYIMFISAVPSLAYIFIFKGIGRAIGLPSLFDMDNPSWLMYILPIVSLALPSIASMMKWMRRYMIDQMNSDYVKFARSGGMSETEIFFKHVMKVSAIPIIQGIPGSLLFAMTGALITERVYLVPGAGGLLIDAINMYDNAVIVGVTLFYAILSVLSLILGDVLMAMVDPRISFTEKAR